jgi:hypothetical protein|tara:strand:+ start:2047 stop:2313 length:267 start_codon:yes stop_codon:yes gene_type:complete
MRRIYVSIDVVTPEEWDELNKIVNSPPHYNKGNIEAIEAIEASMSKLEYQGYLKGSALKYLWRYNYKGKPAEDLKKAKWFLDRLTGVL